LGLQQSRVVTFVPSTRLSGSCSGRLIGPRFTGYGRLFPGYKCVP
jgi:hypothetical protein